MSDRDFYWSTMQLSDVPHRGFVWGSECQTELVAVSIQRHECCDLCPYHEDWCMPIKNPLVGVSCRQAPSSHSEVVSGPASLAGFLWTLGNYMSVIAVDRLGMAVGFPLVQCNLIISNIWALFYYHEIKGRNAICWFLLSTLTILAGVSLLAMYGL